MSDNPFGFNLPPNPGLPPNVIRPSLASKLGLFIPPAVDPQPFRLPLASFLINPQPPPSALGSLLTGLPIKLKKPRIFFSYHHKTDQYYYNEFSRIVHDTYECVYDHSLDDAIDSDDHDYIRQQIRDEFITGTSCTVVLVGPTTYQRKHVDWEIKATLDKGHGLIGIQLPTVVPDLFGRVLVPTRFNANINSGYALWQGFTWYGLVTNPDHLNQLIQIATERDKNLIVNPKEIKKQNG
jgi:hypothetical protein